MTNLRNAMHTVKAGSATRGGIHTGSVITPQLRGLRRRNLGALIGKNYLGKRMGKVLHMGDRLGLGLGGFRLVTQHAPRDIGAEVFAENGLPSGLGLSFDSEASLGGNLPVTSQPLADGGLLDSKGGSHSGLAPEALDRTFDCIHGEQYRHCRCTSQAHCLLQAQPVRISVMHTGSKLGDALKEAMTIKGVKQAAVAEAFGIKQPSVSEWLKFGRIGKKHIPQLVEWFSDVVGPEHWGLPASWVAHAVDAESSEPLDEAQSAEAFTDSDRELLQEVKEMLDVPALAQKFDAMRAEYATAMAMAERLLQRRNETTRQQDLLGALIDEQKSAGGSVQLVHSSGESPQQPKAKRPPVESRMELGSELRRRRDDSKDEKDKKGGVV